MPFNLFLIALTLPLCFSAIAQEQTPNNDSETVERITVSSGFRTQNLQKLAASVSVIDEQLITSRHAQHLEEILNVAANVNFASGASRGRFIQIRGIGERSQFAEPINPSVGFVVDDIDFSGIAGIGTLFDVQQVEILRGPQATEFGAGALAGVIKVKTVEATGKQDGKIALSVAQNNTWSLGAAYGDAITDKLFYRAAIQQYKSDGFIQNIHLGRDDTDNLDEFTSRLKLKYVASDDLSFDLSYQYFDIDNGYDAFSLDNDGKTSTDEPGFDRQLTHAFGLKSKANLSWGDVTVILNKADSDLAYGYDEDWTFVGFHPWEYSSTDHYFRQRDTQTSDIRAVSNPSSALFNDSTNWVVGLYAKSTDETLLREYTFADADFSSIYQQSNYALYAQTDTSLSEHMSLRFGLRTDHFDIDYQDSNGFSESIVDTILGGKLALDYSIDNALVYVSLSRGYKAAGFNPDERLTAEGRIFDAEYNWNYELGVKGNFINYDAFVRLAIFYMDREDTQVSDFATFLREDGTTGFVDIISNADIGTNWGVELESGWQVNDMLSLSANLGWLDATIERYEQADGSFSEKKDQAQSPRYTFNISAELNLLESLVWRVEADGKDEFRFSDGHDELSPSYVLVNTALSYDLDEWVLSLWAKNVFDRTYYVRGFGGFSNDPRDFYETPEPYFQLGDGRQVGVSANYQF
ncbi:MAG: iron complex outermembrane receptor protein [Paraglaciecola sp.]|jgi:iron complex outermembrane receptor protein